MDINYIILSNVVYVWKFVKVCKKSEKSHKMIILYMKFCGSLENMTIENCVIQWLNFEE